MAEIICPNCRKTIRLPTGPFGEMIECPLCGEKFPAASVEEAVREQQTFGEKFLRAAAGGVRAFREEQPPPPAPPWVPPQPNPKTTNEWLEKIEWRLGCLVHMAFVWLALNAIAIFALFMNWPAPRP